MAKVFISYAHEDRDFAERVRKLLPHLGGVEAQEIFLDAQHLAPGEDIRKSIVERIKASNAVIVIMTSRAAHSEWVNYEVGIADALGKPITVVGARGSGKSAFIEKYMHRLANAQIVEVDADP